MALVLFLAALTLLVFAAGFLSGPLLYGARRDRAVAALLPCGIDDASCAALPDADCPP